jgi:hypothetical protein
MRIVNIYIFLKVLNRFWFFFNLLNVLEACKLKKMRNFRICLIYTLKELFQLIFFWYYLFRKNTSVIKHYIHYITCQCQCSICFVIQKFLDKVLGFASVVGFQRRRLQITCPLRPRTRVLPVNLNCYKLIIYPPTFCFIFIWCFRAGLFHGNIQKIIIIIIIINIVIVLTKLKILMTSLPREIYKNYYLHRSLFIFLCNDFFIQQISVEIWWNAITILVMI